MTEVRRFGEQDIDFLEAAVASFWVEEVNCRNDCKVSGSSIS